MTATYKSSGAQAVGLTATSVCSVLSTSNYAIIGGINVANLLGTNVYATIYLNRGGVLTNIIKNKKLGACENAELIVGKITLLPSDKLYAVSSVDSGIDVLVSYMEGV